MVLSIIAGIFLGKVAPGMARCLGGLAIYVGEAPDVSIPIAVCLFFMMYPIMVKINFAEILKAGRSVKPVNLTLFINWAVKPSRCTRFPFSFSVSCSEVSSARRRWIT